VSSSRRIRVLDTTALSALMKGDARAVDRLASCRKPDVLLPQPVIAEVAFGLARLTKSKRKLRLLERFEKITEEIPRVTWTDQVSRCFGSIKAALERRGVPLEDFDVAIASHAVAYEATLVTSNTRHMARIPDLELENWIA